MSTEVKLRRKVQLRKKQEDTPALSSSSKKSKGFLWVIFGVICVAAFVVSQKVSDDPAQSTEDQTVELEQTEDVSTQDVSIDEPIPAVESASAETAQATAPQIQQDEQNPEARNQKSTSKVATQSPISSDRDDIEREALNVIRGMYGDGKIRKEKLGSRYQDIQNRVNQLKKEGLF